MKKIVAAIILSGIVSLTFADQSTWEYGKNRPKEVSETAAPKLAAGALGNWKDSLLNCDVSIEEKAGRFTEVQVCKLVPNERMRQPLIKIGTGKFRLDVQPRKPWYYVIGASGDLEVWDSSGPVRTMTSLGVKSDSQVIEQKKTEARISTLDDKSRGVSIGMTATEVRRSSWGSPLKINSTRTADTINEQWVYSGKYLYFKNGILTAIQN